MYIELQRNIFVIYNRIHSLFRLNDITYSRFYWDGRGWESYAWSFLKQKLWQCLNDTVLHSNKKQEEGLSIFFYKRKVESRFSTIKLQVEFWNKEYQICAKVRSSLNDLLIWNLLKYLSSIIKVLTFFFQLLPIWPSLA